MGPIWDFNLTMAKAWYREDDGVYEGWQVDYRLLRPSDGLQPPFWWEKLAHDKIFQEPARARWEELRKTTFQQDNLFADIDFFVNFLGDAKDRNFEKWPSVLRDNETYESKIIELKEWLINRLAWLDANIGALASEVKSTPSTLKNFNLAQNVPNPFNPETMISFSLPTSTNIELSVYNTMGQKVATLAHGQFPAGSHEVVWDARNFPSSLYFYNLKAGEQVRTNRMLLLK